MINFKYIKPKDIIILDDGYSKIKFDDCSYEYVDFKSLNFFCAIKTLFIFFIKKNSLSLKQIYKQSLYRMYSPKLAISHHINGRGIECKFLCSDIKIAIYQFAYSPTRFKLKHVLGNFKPKKNQNLIDYLFVYHQDDKESIDFPKSKIFVSGSIKNNEIKKKNFKKKLNSLLYISEYDPKNIGEHYYYKKAKRLIILLSKFCKLNNKKFNVALRSNRKDKKIDRKKEIEFFTRLIGKNFNTSSLNSYDFAAQSEVIVCLSSNLGIELLSRKYKVLFVPVHESKYEKYAYLPKNEIFVNRNLQEAKIFFKLQKIYEINKKLWENLLKLKINNLKFDPENKMFKKEIKKIIVNNE